MLERNIYVYVNVCIYIYIYIFREVLMIFKHAYVILLIPFICNWLFSAIFNGKIF